MPWKMSSEGHTNLRLLDNMGRPEEVHRGGFSDVMFPVSNWCRTLNPE